jgi:DNA-binding protein HU-beta
MNRRELVETIAKDSGLSKKCANKVLLILENTIEEQLAKGNDVNIRGFGKFEPKDVQSRTIYLDGTAYEIPSYKSARFVAGDTLKRKLNP